MDTGASSHLADNTGKHIKLPFNSSESNVASVFDIIHSDLWTSPIMSGSGIKFYAIFLDHFSHYVWVTWALVPRPANVNVVRSMWLFRLKFNANGSLSRYKAWLVANGRSQQHGIDCDETFSPRIIALLHNEFSMTNLGSLNYFLGISAQRSASGMFLSQSKFAEEILERSHTQNCNPCRTLVDTGSKLGSDGDPTLYRSLAGALQYLTFTRPDLSYAVQQVCLYMHDSRDPHFTALKHILRYVRAEYRGIANVVDVTAWIRNLLRELHTPLFTVTLVYCDNVSAVYMSANPVQHQRTKHIEIGIHFVCDFVASGQVRVLHVPLRF
ncbi:ribonuclease H-like domain-containing protein [Tanacetum coccineum]